MKTFSVVLGAMALGLVAGAAMADTVSAADQTFAREAAAGGKAEVALGHIATENAGSQKVRAFGERMIHDHSEANEALQEIARRQELTIPDRPDAEDRATAERLQGLKGEAFDTAYIRDMIQDHKKDIADFRREADSGRDPALRAFAQKYLPVLEQHLQMAEEAATRS